MKKVVIIGSGLAGLSAAYYILKKSDKKPEVLIVEKEKYIGGRAHTAYIDGKYIDLGGFMIFPFYKALRRLISELGLDSSMKRLASDTEWYQLKPNSSLTKGEDIPILKLIPFSVLRHIALPILEGKVDFYEPDLKLFDRETVHQFYKEHLPDSFKKEESLHNELFEAYTYTPIAHVPMTLCMSVAKELVFHGMFTRCEHLEGGTSLITSALEKEIENMGGVIRTEAAVKKVKNKKIHLVSGEEITSDEIIFASFPPQSFLKENFNHWQKASHTHYQTVVVEMEKDTNINNEPWFVLYCSMPENRRSPHAASIGQCSSFSNLSGKYLITNISIRKDDTQTHSADELEEICRRDFKQYFPDNAVHKIFTAHDWKHTMPIVDTDLIEEFRLKQGENDVYFVGDYTGFPCMDIAVYSGRRVAEKITLKNA